MAHLPGSPSRAWIRSAALCYRSSTASSREMTTRPRATHPLVQKSAPLLNLLVTVRASHLLNQMQICMVHTLATVDQRLSPQPPQTHATHLRTLRAHTRQGYLPNSSAHDMSSPKGDLLWTPFARSLTLTCLRRSRQAHTCLGRHCLAQQPNGCRVRPNHTLP